MTDTVISSATKEVVIGFERPFVLIGERINPTGRKLLAAEMAAGDFSRVDPRPPKLTDAFQPPVVVNKQSSKGEDVNWYAPLAQILVGEDQLHMARALCKTSGFGLADLPRS